MAVNFNKAEFILSATEPRQFVRDGLPQMAFAGRSNVGKSSCINRLLNRKNFARVGASPGKTTQINYFKIDSKLYLVDLPGYGYAKRSKSQVERLEHIISSYILERQQMTLLFVLVDARLEPQKIDMEFISWLGENGVPFSIVFTKADKLKKTDLRNNVERYKKHLLEEWEELPPIFVTSSETAFGREDLLSYISDVLDSVNSAE